MADQDDDAPVFRVKAGHTGVDLTIGKGLPDVFARVLPFKYRFQRAVDETVGTAILKKIAGDPAALDEAELEFANHLLSEASKKYVRLKRIGERAIAIASSERQVPLLEPIPAAKLRITAQDWINRFQEDASLVDDELLREIYARLLCKEGRQPGAVSLRTLAVLRGMDREVADSFARLQKVIVHDELVPEQDTAPIDAVGITHEDFLVLGDAGLLNASTTSALATQGEMHLFLRGHGKVARASSPLGSSLDLKISGHLLTPAGRQLAAIGEFERDSATLGAVLTWFREKMPRVALLSIATLPFRQWTGDSEALDWQTIPPPP